MSMIHPHIKDVHFDLRAYSDLAGRTFDCIRADIGSISYPVSTIIRSAMKNQSGATKFGYTPTFGDDKFIDALYDYDMATCDVFESPKILVTSGAQAGLFATLMSSINPGDGIITDQAYYPPYRSIADILKAELHSMDLTKPDVKLPENARVLLINHPNNPSGKIYSDELLKYWAGIAEKHNLLVIEDRVYDRVYYNNTPGSIAVYIPERTISLHSASKNACVPGMRIGWMIGEETLVNDIAKVHRNMNSSPNSFFQEVLTEFLPQSDEYFDQLRKTMSIRRDRSIYIIEELGWEVEIPEGGIYVFPRIPNVEDTRDFVTRMIKLAGVSAIPGSCFGPANSNRIRWCFGATDLDALDVLFDRMSAFNEKYKA